MRRAMRTNRSLFTTILMLFGGAVAIILLLVAGQANANERSRASDQLPQWGPDIQVNPAPTGTPYEPSQRNFSLAINPTNSDNVIAGWDSYQSAPSVDAYGWSTDQGLTWSGGRFDGPWNPGAMVPLGNITTVFDAHGTGYYFSQAQGSGVTGYFVLTTTNGMAWSTPVPVVSTDNSAPTAYNEGHLAIDPRPAGLYAGSLYTFWLYTDINYPNFEHGARGRYSRDGGLTWSADVQISDSSNDFIYYPYGTVASDGTVYVAFEELDGYSQASTPKLFLVRSTDGGQSWGANQLITGAPAVRIGRADYEGIEPALVGDVSCNRLVRINHYPMISTSPNDPNTIYATWNDGRWQPPDALCQVQGHHSDIAFSRSTDAGATWSAPVRINDDPIGNKIDHFQPDIAVGPGGMIGVTWLDRRYDANNSMYDLDYSQSTDGGLTWSANQKVSDGSNDPDQLADYKGMDNAGYRRSLVYGPDYVLPSWVSAMPDSLTGNFFTDHGVLDANLLTGTPTASPTGTPTGAPTSTATGTPTSIAATPISTPTTCLIQFTDVPPGSTFYSFVRCLACLGIISGYPCGGFGEPCVPPGNDPYLRPGNSVTRAQAAKIIANSANYQDVIPSARQTFMDVPPGSTFWLYIERVALHGAIHGYPCGGPGEPCPGTYFRPGSNLTRGQLAQIDSSVAGYQDEIPPTRQSFNDVPPGSTFWLFIERVYLHSIINGYPCGGSGEPCPGLYFRPSNNVTRGQTAKIAANTFFPDCSPSVRQ